MHAARLVVGHYFESPRNLYVPAGFCEIADGGVEERFGGLVHCRTRESGSRSSSVRPKGLLVAL
jgi:hypothetical protein